MRFVIIPVFEASILELLIGSSNKLKIQGWCESFFFPPAGIEAATRFCCLYIDCGSDRCVLRKDERVQYWMVVYCAEEFRYK